MTCCTSAHHAHRIYARWPHILGLLTALLFGIEAVSGILLAFYYQPTTLSAYDSTRSIVRDVMLGWLVHHVHMWGSYLLCGVVLLRMLRSSGTVSTRRRARSSGSPRSASRGSSSSSTSPVWLLPWDVKSYWAAQRGLEIVWSLPVVGSVPLDARRRPFDERGRAQPLLRAAHHRAAADVPIAFVYLTFATMRRVGLSRIAGAVPKLTTFRRHVSDLVVITLLLFAGLVTLATLMPYSFHGAADPYQTPKGTLPPWYMLAPYALFQLPIPRWIPGLGLLAVALALPFVPAPCGPPGIATTKRLRMVGLRVFGLWLVLSVLGAFVDRR